MTEKAQVIFYADCQAPHLRLFIY